MSGPKKELPTALLDKALRAAVANETRSILHVNRKQAEAIVDAFETFVAQPLQRNLQRMGGRDLARRNPMIYTVRGVRAIDDWVDRVIEDKETSAVEGHLGTFLEEAARIVSGGIKPGNGVDLQVEGDDDVVYLYALQTSGNTKNSGSRSADVDALKRAARPLRAARRHVDLNIGVLHGRAASGIVGAEPDITVLGSDAFWDRVSGIPGFRSHLLAASLVLARLVQGRAAEEVERIREEARQLFADENGELALDALGAAGQRKAARTVKKSEE